jgi:geranylgeranyl diphosphate synthase type II
LDPESTTRPARPAHADDARSPARPDSSTVLARRVDEYIDVWLAQRELPTNLREAIRYALLAPGKRARPILVLRSAVAVGGTIDGALAAAAAVEMVHAFSLVHDDLPALDNDDLRRGRPTLHRHSGEAMAILAGDAMLGLAVELITTRLHPSHLVANVCRELVEGCNNMIAGQVYDTLPELSESTDPVERLRVIHSNKTGALIRAACRMGAFCGGADETQLAGVTRFGEKIGLMFQVVDDLLDVTQTTEHLGKTAGKDVDQQKWTYPAVVGLDATRREVVQLRSDALGALDSLGTEADPLRDLCETLAVRTR